MQAKYYIIYGYGLHRKYYDSLDDVFDHEGFYYVDDYNNIKVYDYYSCQRIDPEEIERLHKIYRKKLTKERIDTYWGKRPYKFRNGPVPRTGRRSNYGYWRHPKTAQELRNIDCFTRAKRKNIPTSWDDLERGDWRDKNWKRYRKHQWKS